ncbi:MAG TPA: MFS transporter, partial [Actinomycetota bacterium]|nr:MFS transporter [Actinomycetota bacterium]
MQASDRAHVAISEAATTPGITRLRLHQASSSAGDALVALALAGSLFFSVPETTARGRVGLYLA